MKKLLLLISVFAAAYIGIAQSSRSPYAHSQEAGVETNSAVDRVFAYAFANHQSHVAVQGGAIVTKILPDDNDGVRHQRLIVQLASGQTLLIAHNIDLAGRIASMRVGDRVEFRGEYEWNSKGGVIHWTHHDPSGRHSSGWLKHNGQTYL